MSSREYHSCDYQSYIDRVAGGWGVWWEGFRVSSNSGVPKVFSSRKAARTCIQGLKKIKVETILQRLYAVANKDDVDFIRCYLFKK